MAASLQTPNTPPTPTSAKQLSSSARQTVPASTHPDIPTDTAASIQPTHHNSQQSARANHQKRHQHQPKLLPNNTPGAPQPAKTSPQVKSSTQRRGQQNLTARLQTSSQPSTEPHCAETPTAPSKRRRRKSPNTVAPTDAKTVTTNKKDQAIKDILTETTEQPTVPTV